MGSCAVKSKVVDSSSSGPSNAFNNEPCYPATSGQCNWSVNNNGGSTMVVSNIVAPTAPPESPPVSNNNEGTWAIAYANESNGVVQQPYGQCLWGSINKIVLLFLGAT